MEGEDLGLRRDWCRGSSEVELPAEVEMEETVAGEVGSGWT